MPKLSIQDAALIECPSVDENIQADEQLYLALGDLHGNALKLLYFLTRHGIIKTTKEDYTAFQKLYDKPAHELTRFDIQVIKSILSRTTVNPKSRICLIGDIFSDRGNNDLLTLMLLDHLEANKVPVDILLSNHDSEFINSYETKSKFVSEKIVPEICTSIAGLQKVIDNKQITFKSVQDMIERTYKPNLKLLSYSLDEINKSISLYSHAGIGIDEIKKIAKLMVVDYNDDCMVSLAKTIDKINDAFAKKYITTNKVNTLFSNPVIYNLMWNRKHDGLNRPKIYNGYYLEFIHGHDINDLSKENIINLDNDCGKGNNGGEYSVVYSKEKQLLPMMAETLALLNKYQTDKSITWEEGTEPGLIYSSLIDQKEVAAQLKESLSSIANVVHVSKTALGKFRVPLDLNKAHTFFKTLDLLQAKTQGKKIHWEKDLVGKGILSELLTKKSAEDLTVLLFGKVMPDLIRASSSTPDKFRVGIYPSKAAIELFSLIKPSSTEELAKINKYETELTAVKKNFCISKIATCKTENDLNLALDKIFNAYPSVFHHCDKFTVKASVKAALEKELYNNVPDECGLNDKVKSLLINKRTELVKNCKNKNELDVLIDNLYSKQLYAFAGHNKKDLKDRIDEAIKTHKLECVPQQYGLRDKVKFWS